jgi:hypothetical protein
MRLARSLLATAARRPLLALLLVAAVAFFALRGSSGDGGASPEDGNPRLILGRVWFDQYPEKRTDTVQIFIFLGGGIGLYESGSVWRASTDIFDFERQGSKIHMTFLHDKTTAETKFKVTACDEKPPFDLCLDLDSSPRGPKRYYGFGDEEDFGRKVPWGRALVRAAESRAAMK